MKKIKKEKKEGKNEIESFIFSYYSRTDDNKIEIWKTIIESNYTKEELNNIDIKLTDVIVRIFNNHNIEKIKKDFKRNLTVFDFKIDEGNFNQLLILEENQKIRKSIHELLKNDWDIQTKQ